MPKKNKDLKKNKLLIIKTFTIPGFVWRIQFDSSEQIVNKLKNRDKNKHYQLLCKNLKTALKYWDIKYLQKKIKKEWLTQNLTLIINNKGIRREKNLPDESVYKGTSINYSNSEPLINLEDIIKFLDRNNDKLVNTTIIWDETKTSTNKSSKILKINKNNQIIQLR